MKKKESGYHGSMVVLYIICRFAWNLYLKYWQQFAKVNSKYTQQYGEDQLTAVNAAKDLPDANQRRGNTGKVSVKLEEGYAGAMMCWQTLKSIILNAYPPAEQNAALLEAGSAHYTKAAKRSYSQAAALINAGQNFITQNYTTLQGGGMPATFAADYLAAVTAFDQEYDLYSNAKGTAKDDTTGKIAANNALFAALMPMLADAGIVFKKNKTVRQQFTYVAIRSLVTKDVMGGLHFLVRDVANGKPLVTAAVTLSSKDKSYPVNKRGALELRLSKGTYTAVVSVPGYTPYIAELTVSGGVMHRVNVNLEMVKVAAA